MKSVMNHNFSQIPDVQVPRSVFRRDHGHKMTFSAGQLIPFFVDEVLPGDTHKLKAHILARLNTPIVPVMDNMYLETFFFFVPNRLVWDNWQKFNGEQDDPGDSIDFEVPVVTCPAGGFTEESLADYFGIPTKVDNLDVSAFHFRAWNLIFNEWFRCQNTRDSKPVPKGDGPDVVTGNYDFGYYRSKKHDYFTSCLPDAQRGDAVGIGLAGNADVWGNGKTLGLTDGTTPVGLYEEISGNGIANAAEGYNINLGAQFTPSGSIQNERGVGVVEKAVGAESGLTADLTSATAILINDLREAFQIQKLLEKDARGGTRYIEILKSHFGVTSPDARLQRPEYLGGGRMKINITPVPQTSASADSGGDAGTPQGYLAGYGVSAGSNHGFNKSFVEHGVIIGMVNVSADLTYQQGLHKMWSRRERYDFYWPSFAHLGESPVLNKEIYAQGTAADELVFGYQERFAEMRYKPSQVVAKFRNNATNSLDVWHLSVPFASLPTLNAGFMRDSAGTAIQDVIQVPTEPQFTFDSYIELTSARPLPTYSVPGYIDHF